MAFVNQYPHFLFIEEAGESTQDEHGNWTECDVSRKFISMCREESDGKGTEYQVAGANTKRQHPLFNAPKLAQRMPKAQK